MMGAVVGMAAWGKVVGKGFPGLFWPLSPPSAASSGPRNT